LSSQLPGLHGNHRPDCQKQIDGFVGAKYKKFDNQKEAEEFVRFGPKTSTKPAVRGGTVGVGASFSHSRPSPYAQTTIPARSVLNATITTRAEPAFKSTSATKSNTADKDHSVNPNGADMPVSDALVIYTDGSSLSNGKVGSQAGVGVFFGVDDPRNVSERLNSEPQTNQRAELMVGSRIHAV
jgi:ribonuclease HI